MIGTIVNVGCILTGSIAGSLIKKGINEKHKNALFTAMGLAAIGIGTNSIAQNMPKSEHPVLFIAALALGSLLGSVLDIDTRFHRLVDRFSGKGKLAEGLSTALLLFCIGTLSILGPINSALKGDHTFLFTNATLDLVSSCVLASAYGIGISLAAPVLFCWQGSIYLLAKLLGNFMSAALLCEISTVGGFLIMASGISILELKQIKTLNMLPCLLVPPVYFLLRGLLGI